MEDDGSPIILYESVSIGKKKLPLPEPLPQAG
jgi:hypothetical protein